MKAQNFVNFKFKKILNPRDVDKLINFYKKFNKVSYHRGIYRNNDLMKSRYI